MDVVLEIEGMKCAGCVAHVEDALKRTPGVQEAAVSLEDGRARVSAEEGADASAMAEAVRAAGYVARVEG
ncbi:MAG: cation transporter [Gemmatimonadota bacterium]|nr:cation transporter [Gemmatimonadota bacterium]